MSQKSNKTPPSAIDGAKKARIVLWIILGTIVAAALIWYAVLTTIQPAPNSAPDATPQPSADVQLVREDSHKLTTPATEKAQLVEFLDFECEACGAMYPVVEEMKKEFGDRVTFINRYFPLPGHRNSGTAALAVEAAAQQGKYEQMYNKMFQTQAQWGEQQETRAPLFRTFAQELELDMAAYDVAVSDEKTKDRIRKDIADGKALGVTGTPTFFLNGEILELTSEADFRQQLTEAAQ